MNEKVINLLMNNDEKILTMDNDDHNEERIFHKSNNDELDLV